MRFSGQGMMSHTATTTISRYFTKSRGKALSTGWFGLSAGRIYSSSINSISFSFYDWKNIWLTYFNNSNNFFTYFFIFSC